MKELDELRGKIDKIDDKLIKLLTDRAKLGIKVAKVKGKAGAPVFFPARERQILKKVADDNKGPLSDTALQNVFREIFSATRSVERALKYACLGPAGSFSHLAALKLFGSSSESILNTDIDSVFHEVERGVADYGVVPIENSIEGAVGRTLDLLISSPVKIFNEFYFDIHINLNSKAKKIGDVKTLYTHYMPLGQCRQWIASNMPGVKIVDTSSTTAAAMKAKDDPKSAALGSYEAAKIYQLNILAEQVEDRTGNQTRFLVISMNGAPHTGKDKTSVLFSISHESGALQKILRQFSARSLNLSKIESRPSPAKEWEYIFFVDFDGHMDDPDAQWAIKKIKPLTLFLKQLGSYPNTRA